MITAALLSLPAATEFVAAPRPLYLSFVELDQFLLVFAVVCVLALVAAEELLDLLSVLGLQLLQSDLLLLLKLVLGLAESAQLLLKGASHLLHLSGHGHHALRVLPEQEQMMNRFQSFKKPRWWCTSFRRSDLLAGKLLVLNQHLNS